MKEKLLNHKFIVFCQDHYNPLGIIRSLGEKGIRPFVILESEHPVMINHSRYVEKLHLVKTQEEGFRLLLDLYGNEPEKPFLYTASDDITSLLDLHYDELIDKFYFFHGRKQGIVTRYMDKENICNLAVKHGCEIAKTEIVTPGVLPSMVSYPLMTKAIISTLGGWKNDSFICHNEQELIEAYKHIRSPKILLQEYITKKNELCLDGFCFNEGEDVYIPYYSNYLRFSNKSYGPYMVLKPFLDEKVMSQVKAILKEVGFTGIFSVEFLIDQNDKLYFLEVNFRNSTWSYAYTCGGYNMPYLWAKATLEEKLDLSNIKPLEEYTAMVEPDDFVENVLKHRKIGIRQWAKEVESAQCYYWNKEDNSPFWHYLWMRLWRPIKKKFNSN